MKETWNLRTGIEAERHVPEIRIRQETGAVNRVALFGLLFALFGLTSCHHAAAPSTAVTCTTTSSTSSSTSSITCTNPVTNISLTVSPATLSLSVTAPQQFNGSLSGSITNNKIIWKVSNVTNGNPTVGVIDANGFYHAPRAVPSPNPVSVTATSYEDQNLSTTAMVTILPAPVVTITSPLPPYPVQVTSGAANQVAFSATETGGQSTDVIYWCAGPVGGAAILGGNSTFGAIDANGLYTPPLTPPIGSSALVTAAISRDCRTSATSVAVTISGYSTSSLQGPFAFSMAGQILSGPSTGAFFRSGSFMADGLGNLSGGLEDINETSGVTPGHSFAGTYTVLPGGRGTLSFSDPHAPANLPSNFDFVLVNGSQIQITGFDASKAPTYSGTVTGQADAQDATTFNDSALNGTFVFDFAGMHGSNAISEIGEFTTNGAGRITGGSIDINDNGASSTFQIIGVLLNPPNPPTYPSFYSIDPNGRGTATIATNDATFPTLTFSFYIVSRGSAKFVGTDDVTHTNVTHTAGAAMQQAPTATFNNALINGNYAFLLSGSASGATITTAGSFSADGAGCFTKSTGILDENISNGIATQNVAFSPLPAGDPQCPGYAGKYTVDSSGRGTITFQTSNRTYNLVLYVGPVSIVTHQATGAVLQETDSNITSDGTFAQQSSSSIQGHYAIHTSGLLGPALQVISGQIVTDGVSQVTSGLIDVNTSGMLAAGQPASGSYSSPAASGRATLALNSTSANYAAYIVSSTQIFLVGIQTSQVAAGELLRQF